MATNSGAPAALQPDDAPELARWRDWLASFDEQFWTEHKAGVYTAPVMDGGAPARAGEWLGVRVYHEHTREFGRIVGMDAHARFWVEIALTPGKPARPMLIAGDALTIATPELEAAEAARRAQMRALLGPVKPGSGNRKGGRPHGRKTNQPDDPTIRRCKACGRVLPIEQFRFNNKAANRRAYLCRDCDNQRKREFRAAHRVQPAGMRRCQACGEVLPLSEFRTDRNRAEGKAYECRECYNRRMNAYYHRRRYGLAAKGAE